MNKTFFCFFQKIVLFLFLGLCVFSCSFDESKNVPSFAISSPQANWVYYDDTPICFSTNVHTTDIEWSSSVIGSLGKGNGIHVRLPSGKHTISATFGGQTTHITVQVRQRVFPTTKDFRYFLTSASRNIFLPAGEYSLFACALDGSATALHLEQNPSRHMTTPRFLVSSCDQNDSFQTIHVQTARAEEHPRLHDIRLPSPSVGKPISIAQPSANNSFVRFQTAGTVLTGTKAPETERHFFVINTKNQLLDPHDVNAKVYRSGANYTLWLPDTVTVDEALDARICELESELDSHLLPRVKMLWGDWADIDSDGKIAFLLSPTKNE